MTTKTSTNATHREPLSETEALRIDRDLTRQHLADTVQQLSRQLDVPRRLKESAGQAGHRIQGRMRDVPGQLKQMQARMKDVPGRLKEMPAASRRHPKATAAVGGALAIGVGATTWMVCRHK